MPDLKTHSPAKEFKILLFPEPGFPKAIVSGTEEKNILLVFHCVVYHFAIHTSTFEEELMKSNLGHPILCTTIATFMSIRFVQVYQAVLTPLS